MQQIGVSDFFWKYETVGWSGEKQNNVFLDEV